MAALNKYLSRYAEPESFTLTDFPGHYQQGLVIPFYQEPLSSLQRFISFAENNPSTLLIIVLNRPRSNTHCNWAQTILATLAGFKTQWQHQQTALRLLTLEQQSSLLLVDRCIHGPAIPDNQGVGLARKIGADILCTLIQQQLVSSPWIANSDADATLPTDYFQAQVAYSNKQNIAALCYPFEHVFVDQTPRLPTLLYAFSLHYYVAGLSYAHSPYNYHTIGSAIAVHYQHYAMVRGFPKRAAAEDFYLLNKLAKTGAIISLQQPLIKLQARESDRVPFGTGPAVTRLANFENPLAMPLYHPDSFIYLKFFLVLLTLLAEQPLELDLAIARIQHTNKLNVDAKIIHSLGQELGLAKALSHCYQHSKQAAGRLRHLLQWFDSFKTLKFIHYLRDHHLGTIEYQHWANNKTLFPHSSTMLQLQRQIKALS